MIKSFVGSLIGLEPAESRREAVLSYLLDNDLVDNLSLGRAREVAQRARQPLEATLNQTGAVSDEALTKAYAQVTGCPIWDPKRNPPAAPPEQIDIAIEYLRENKLLPLWRESGRIAIAACDPLDDEALGGIGFATGLIVEIWIAAPSDWRRAFSELYGDRLESVAPDERKIEQALQVVSDSGAESESSRMVAQVFETALMRRASDIHFEPRRHDLRIRLRVDGRLVDLGCASSDLSSPVVSRVKVLANLDLGERRLPQDGRATFVVGGRPIEARISTLPSAFGESVVLRLLDREGLAFDYSELGFDHRQKGLLEQVSRTPHGIFIVTGPTGSGKTTTLYALLNSFADSEKKILSVEDPIEYHFDHVVQVQTAATIGLNFSNVLRSFLRQDPDIILVGEIRDAETAQVAIQAAMTGHLVLASLHANDAIRVIPRLLDMGIEPYQIAAALVGSLAQRLVRRLCPACRTSTELTVAERAFVETTGFAPPAYSYRTVGCPACGGVGFKGRIALAEGLRFGGRLSDAIARGEPAAQLHNLAVQDGFHPMIGDGLAKVACGQTTMSEVMASVGG